MGIKIIAQIPSNCIISYTKVQLRQLFRKKTELFCWTLSTQRRTM